MLWTAVAAVVVLSVSAELRSVVRPDIGFLLYAAGRVLDGARLYVDVVEINPPLIVGLNLPPVILARLLGLSDILVYRISFTLGLLGLLVLSWRGLCRVLPGPSAELRSGLLVLLAFILFPLAAQDFGQREHLLLAVLMPYLLATAARALGRPLPWREAVLVGFLAGIGLALKPYFLLLWPAAEWYGRRASAPRSWRPRPEGWTIGVVLTLYGVFVLVMTPQYLTLITLLGGLYGSFLHDSFFHLLVTGPGASLILVSLLAFAALRSHARHPHLWDVVMIGVAGCFLGACLQQKGLRYHFYPAFGLAAFLLGLAGVDLQLPLRSGVQRLYRLLALSLTASAAIVVSIDNLGQIIHGPFSGDEDELQQLVRRVRVDAAGSSVFVMSYHIGSAFPLINYAGVRSASRFPQLWILAAAYRQELEQASPLRYREPSAMSPGERFLNDAVYADLRRADPELLVVLRHARDLPANGYRRLDYIAYFRRNPRIAEILDHYERIDNIGEYALYRRVDPGARRAGPPPAPERATQDVQRTDRGGLQLRLHDRDFLLRVAIFLLTFLSVAWLSRSRETDRPATTG